jgi:hypothetical protein
VLDESPAADVEEGEDLIKRLIYRADQPAERRLRPARPGTGT